MAKSSPKRGRFSPIVIENETQLSVRAAHCRLCQQRFYICGRCDRGQFYCTRSCAQLARRASQNRSARNYRDSAKGRASQARRQAAFRRRRQLTRAESGSSVTHQGSVSPATAQVLDCGTTEMGLESTEEDHDASSSNDTAASLVLSKIRCSFCNSPCPSLVRTASLAKASTADRRARQRQCRLLRARQRALDRPKQESYSKR